MHLGLLVQLVHLISLLVPPPSDRVGTRPTLGFPTSISGVLNLEPRRVHPAHLLLSGMPYLSSSASLVSQAPSGIHFASCAAAAVDGLPGYLDVLVLPILWGPYHTPVCAHHQLVRPPLVVTLPPCWLLGGRSPLVWTLLLSLLPKPHTWHLSPYVSTMNLRSASSVWYTPSTCCGGALWPQARVL